MTTITTTMRPALAERQNNYDPKTHATNKKDGKTTPLKLRVQPTPSTPTEPTTPSASTTAAATPKKTPSQQQKKAKKQAQIPVLKTDDSYATVTKKKVYSKDFLNQYRTVGDQTFPLGAAPADLIRMYNEAFEKKEQAAKAAEIAGVSNQPRPIDPSRPNPTSAPTTPANKEEEKKKKRSVHSSTTVKPSKFKNEGDESLFSKPFPTHSFGVKIPPRPVFTDVPVVTDKENIDGTSATPQKRTPSNKKPTSTRKSQPPQHDHTKSTPATPTNDAQLLQKLTDLMQQQKTDNQQNANAIESSDDNDGTTDAAKTKIQEQDPRRLAQRQKQIDFGKVTAGYKAYTTLVPKCKRKRDDAKTPNKFQVCSKRSWDGQIRKWRRQLHNYDPEGTPMPADEGDDDYDDEDNKDGVDIKVEGRDIKVEGGDD